MNLSSLLYKDENLTEADTDWIVEVFGHPTMKKYLSTIARNDLSELATIATQDLSDTSIARKHSLVQGKLSTIVTLLNIQKQEHKS
jgi:hypothetical protein